MRLVIIDTGVSNSASVGAAVRRATGLEPELTVDPKAVESADRVILPGVGSFAAGMAALERHGLSEVVRERVLDERATLAICLGMQLLCEASAESPGVEGLGVVEGRLERFPPGALRTPHFGWNRVSWSDGDGGGEDGEAYFAHSYRLERAPEGGRRALCVHGGAFVAALSRGGVLACQFHPELSGAWGAALIARWARAREGAAC